MNKTDTLAHKLALESAYSMISSFCAPAPIEGFHDLDSVGEEKELVDEAVEYLELRQLLRRHPDNNTWVAIPD